MQLGILLSGLWNPSNRLIAPDFKELEDSLASERKESSLTLVRVQKLESKMSLFELEVSSLKEDLKKAHAAKEAAEKEMHDLSVHHSLQESQIHREGTL